EEVRCQHKPQRCSELRIDHSRQGLLGRPLGETEPMRVAPSADVIDDVDGMAVHLDVGQGEAGLTRKRVRDQILRNLEESRAPAWQLHAAHRVLTRYGFMPCLGSLQTGQPSRLARDAARLVS